MKGDRERCLAAGMDGYLSKPLRRQGLLAAVDEALDRRPGGAALQKEVMLTSMKIWDREETFSRAEGDTSLIQEVTTLFLRDLDTLLPEIEKAVSAGDAKALEQAAHRLKGSASFFEAHEVVESAQSLENRGEAGDLREAAKEFSDLKARAERLRGALSSLLEEIA